MEKDEVEIGDVNVRSLHGYRGCLRQSERLKGSNKLSLPIREHEVRVLE